MFFEIIRFFYPENTPFRELLIKHSTQVRDKALEIAAASGVSVDTETVICGAMLHDIGIGKCHAPSILCMGNEPYIRHGILGAQMLREHFPALEKYARICERHTGSGLAAKEIIRQSLPLPPRDFLPETPEEKLLTLADKFFSKSGDMQEKDFLTVRRSMEKFGTDSLERFDELCRYFRLEQN
ncbi:MAG: HDIG domain-containing protein [Lentisphaeria bacterium]|nr:HDIG domain-containing protein [Lentisphaeria bacterium]MBQ8754418.1 HDIG domain-containing protein [Lentisphaeria bacterium]